MSRHRHPRLLPQVTEGENVLSLAHMSAKQYAAGLAGSPMVARAVERYVERERKYRAERLTRPPDWTASTARSRRRERRRLEREEHASQSE
jgi:hypothetical protein